MDISPTSPYNVFIPHPEGQPPIGRADEQSALFYNMLMAKMPASVKSKIEAYRLLADIGCSYGAGTAILATAFPNLWCMGLDVAPDAIARATNLYVNKIPNIQFITRRVEALGNNVDVIVCSNMLEHYDDPVVEFAKLAEVATKMLIVIVPFKEEPLTRYHRITFFKEGPLPQQHNKFKLNHIILHDCRGTGYWHGDQAIMIYEA